MTSIKICGLSDKSSVSASVMAGADYIGFVFFDKSPRNISPKLAAELSCEIPPSIKRVAVVVDPSDEFLAQIFEHFQPDYLQLHGNESVARIVEIKLNYDVKIIKAFSVRNGDDIAASLPYGNVVDMFLFDAKAPKNSNLPGGNGLSFDWNLLANRDFALPWMLSGGLNSQNLRHAIDITGAKIVDASSSLEIEAGVKNIDLIQEFLGAVK